MPAPVVGNITLREDPLLGFHVAHIIPMYKAGKRGRGMCCLLLG